MKYIAFVLLLLLQSVGQILEKKVNLGFCA